MVEMTYGRMEEILRSIGFTLREITESNKVYRHDVSGAMVIFPEFPSETTVLPRHLLAVKSVLRAYGIADPTEFANELQRAS